MMLLLAAVLLLQDPVPLPETFAHPWYSFKISMPAKWSRGPASGKADVSFYGAKGEPYVPRVDVYLTKTDMEFAKYVATIKTSLMKGYADAKVLSDDLTIVRGRTAQFFKVSFTDGGIAMRTMWMAVAAKGYVYLAGWACPEASSARHERGVEAMMKSLRVYDMPDATKEQRELYQKHRVEAEALYKDGKFAEAAALFAKCATLMPKFPEIHANVGLAWVQARNYVDAEAAYRKAIDLDPDDHDHYMNFGSVLMQQGKTDAAIEALLKAVKGEPTLSKAWTNLGLAYIDKHNYADAATALEKAVALDPESVPPHFNLGVAYEFLGKKDRAIAEFKEALKLNPTHQPSAEALKRLTGK